MTTTHAATVYLASVLEAVGLLQQMSDVLGTEEAEALQVIDRSLWRLLDAVTEPSHVDPFAGLDSKTNDGWDHR